MKGNLLLATMFAAIAGVREDMQPREIKANPDFNENDLVEGVKRTQDTFDALLAGHEEKKAASKTEAILNRRQRRLAKQKKKKRSKTRRVTVFDPLHQVPEDAPALKGRPLPQGFRAAYSNGIVFVVECESEDDLGETLLVMNLNGDPDQFNNQVIRHIRRELGYESRDSYEIIPSYKEAYRTINIAPAPQNNLPPTQF